MSIFQKSATISFSDSISQPFFFSPPHRQSDDYQENEMLVGLNGAGGEETCLFEENLADIFLMCSFVEGAITIEQRVREEKDAIKAQVLRNFLFFRLKRLLPHEYERLFGQEKAKWSMPIPFRSPVELAKPTASLKTVQFTRRGLLAFEPKSLARHLAIAEAFLFVNLDERELLKSSSSQIDSISDWIEHYNRLSSILISATLESDNPVKTIQFILKMTKEFYELGTMNGFKACMAAIQSTSIHRLHLQDHLPEKYQKRLKAFEDFSQAKDNFASMRKTQCLVPWMGLLLKDVDFITEIVKLKGSATCVGGSLSRIFNSMADSRGACAEWLQRNKQMLPRAGKILNWLDETPITFSTDELQYQKSKAIKP